MRLFKNVFAIARFRSLLSYPAIDPLPPNGFGLYNEPEKLIFKPCILSFSDKKLFNNLFICPERKSEILLTKISTPEFTYEEEPISLGANLLNTTKNATCLFNSFSLLSVTLIASETVKFFNGGLSGGKSRSNFISGLNRSPFNFATTYT